MATNNKESLGEKVGEWFTQSKEDYEYEQEGGDARVPAEFRVGVSPRQAASIYAVAHGESDPYPEDRNLEGVDLDEWKSKYDGLSGRDAHI